MVLLGSSSGFNLLEVHPGLVFWTLVTFLVVVFVLKKFAWDVILHALDERQGKIQDDIHKASSLKKEAEEELKNYKSKIAKAHDEAQAILNEARNDANALKTKILHDATAEATRIKELAERDIELSKGKALHEIQKKTVELSILIASEVLEKKLKEEDYSAFIDQELAKLEKSTL